MTRRSVRAATLAVALGLALLLACSAGEAAKAPKPARGPKTWAFSFAADTLGQKPTNSAVFGGQWEVSLLDSTAMQGLTATDSSGALVDSAAPAPAPAPRVLRQTETDDGIQFHYIQFKKPVLGDLVASVRFRIRSGEIDPTAGLMLQLDPKGKSGYLIRVSGEKRRLIAHYLLYGKRRDLRYVEIDPPAPGEWHKLEVERRGSVLVIRYDGAERLRLRDERYKAGTLGLWTEDDTVVEFADLTASTN